MLNTGNETGRIFYVYLKQVNQNESRHFAKKEGKSSRTVVPNQLAVGEILRRITSTSLVEVHFRRSIWN